MTGKCKKKKDVFFLKRTGQTPLPPAAGANLSGIKLRNKMVCVSEENGFQHSNFNLNSTLELITTCNGTQPVSEPKWRPQIKKRSIRITDKIKSFTAIENRHFI